MKQRTPLNRLRRVIAARHASLRIGKDMDILVSFGGLGPLRVEIETQEGEKRQESGKASEQLKIRASFWGSDGDVTTNHNSTTRQQEQSEKS